MKPSDGRYQTATQVKVFSPVIINVREVDSVHLLEDSMWHTDMARCVSLSRGLSPWYGIEWRLSRCIGRRALLFFGQITHFYGQVRDNKSELILVIRISPELALRNKRYTKVGDDKSETRGFAECIKAVGLTHSRGVAGVMPCESASWRTLEGVSVNM